MRAVISDRYGPPEILRIEEVEKPSPGPGELLVRIHATSVTSGDARLRAFRVPGLFWLPARLALGFRRPHNTVLGMEFAGEVEALGEGAEGFEPGERIFGLSIHGCHADYKAIPAAAAIARIPDGVAWAEAAAVPFGAMTALHFLGKGGIRAGDRVLVNGASGAVGVYALQLARHFGAEVTGVCGPANVDLVRSLGAASVVDHSREDFAGRGETYDIVFDTVGTASYSRCRRVLARGGVYLAAVTEASVLLQGIRASLLGGPRVIAGVSQERPENMAFLAELLEAGEVRPVVGARFPLERIAEAHRLADSGHKVGAAVVTVSEEAEADERPEPLRARA